MRLNAIADIVHDLRTPLVSMRGYGRMILEERVGSLNSTQKEYVGTVVRNMNQMVTLLDELASIATLEPLSLAPIDVCSVLRESLRQWKTRAQAKRVTLEEEISCEPLSIEGDKDRLQHAFEGILDQVVHSAQAGAEIVVDFSGCSGGGLKLRISEARGAGEAASEGISAPPATPPVPWRASQSDGSGVSLASANSIVRLHGGRVSVAEDAAGGRTLTVTFRARSDT